MLLIFLSFSLSLVRSLIFFFLSLVLFLPLILSYSRGVYFLDEDCSRDQNVDARTQSFGFAAIVALWKSIMLYIPPKYDGRVRKDISAHANYPITSATTGPDFIYIVLCKTSPSRIILSCSHARSQTFLTLFTFLLFVSNLIISISAVPTVRWIIVTHDSSLFLLYRFSLLAKRDGRFHSKNKSNIE